jgi:outer membrane protein
LPARLDPGTAIGLALEHNFAIRQAREQIRRPEGVEIEVRARQAFSSPQEAWELVQASGKTAEQAAEALRLADVRHQAGTATQLDVLTSQVALTQARLNQLLANYGYHVARAAARQAPGLPDEDLRP